MGISLGHVGSSALGLTTLVGLVTIALSTYMILYSYPLHERLMPWLGMFERRCPHRELAVERDHRAPDQPDVVVFGLGRYGGRLAPGLQEAKLGVLGVDFDPELARTLRHKGLPTRFGDGLDHDFLESLPLDNAAWVISTLPDIESNRALPHVLKERRYQGGVAIVAREEKDGSALKQAGAPTVAMPSITRLSISPR